MRTPFLIYLTVFKSRLGLVNIVMPIAGFAHQPRETILRKIRNTCDAKVSLSLAEVANRPVFQYLLEKKLVGTQSRSSGRYRDVTLDSRTEGWTATQRGAMVDEFLVFEADVWLSNPDVPSTIGVPTKDNAAEYLELTLQLRLLSPAKFTWTSAGQLVHSLRQLHESSTPGGNNPFLLRTEGIALLRQLIEVDGPMLLALLRVAGAAGPSFTRNEIAARFEEIVVDAIAITRERGTPGAQIRIATDFLKAIRDTTQTKGASRRSRTTRTGLAARSSEGGSSGPGVVEHRTSPRLEWLTDLGYLSKDGLPKNAFEYKLTDSAAALREALEKNARNPAWAEDVAIEEWVRNPLWGQQRVGFCSSDLPSAVSTAYELMRRRVGPSPLKEVSFLTSLLIADGSTFEEVNDQVIAFAANTPGASLSGGRYGRTPENIYLADGG